MAAPVAASFFAPSFSPIVPRSATLSRLPRLLADIRACGVCGDALPLGPRPVLQASTTARLLIVGQAPGAKVHASGIPWDDASGERLRAWLGIGKDVFYDAARVAIVPMGFCYPGRGASGDNPPRPECAALWHERLLALLPQVRLTLLVGQYAQRYMLGARRKASLTETVEAWREYGPDCVPLPHPSPRNQAWFKHHPWFGHDVLPALRARVAALMDAADGASAAASLTASPTSAHRGARIATAHQETHTMTQGTIEIQRVYEPLPDDGRACFLVDRLWPRGIRKETLAGVTWAKDVAPSTALRQWFHASGTDAAHWDEFRRRYLAELDANREGWQPLADASAQHPIVLLYGAHDTEHNHAAVLRDFLAKHRHRK
ncbi:uracil-DNA glycosylase [Paraburkholderia tropica]|uniref:Uracil-DNA glycosylase n=3 Tax=Paraburkholderia tropica TaxID=92647 RepID=A0ABX5ML30_9BURK|nr:uracil-DNA glycosylase [Paraburkholderia tropica]PZW79080.1 uracil-DNA glycosylase [Paraburkholderia tropica]